MGKGRQRLASRGVRAQKQRARRRGVSFYRPFASVHLHTYHPDIWLEPGLFLFHPMTVIFPPKVYVTFSEMYQQVPVVVQSLSRVRLFATPWTAAHKASRYITNFRSLLKFMSVESERHPTISSSVVPFSSNLQSFPASGAFPMSQLFTSGGQSIGVSAPISVLPVNIQD